MSCAKGQAGHVLLETMAALSLVGTILVLFSGLLMDEWNGARCAYLSFELGHARLTGSRDLRSPSGFRVEETEDSVRVDGRCGRATEHVEFIRLENARW